MEELEGETGSEEAIDETMELASVQESYARIEELYTEAFSQVLRLQKNFQD